MRRGKKLKINLTPQIIKILNSMLIDLGEGRLDYEPALVLEAFKVELYTHRLSPDNALKVWKELQHYEEIAKTKAIFSVNLSTHSWFLIRDLAMIKFTQTRDDTFRELKKQINFILEVKS